VLQDEGEIIAITLFVISDHYGDHDDPDYDLIEEPVRVKIPVLNRKGQEISKQTVTSQPITSSVELRFVKENIKSSCEPEDHNYFISCKILSHIKLTTFSSVDSPLLAMDCSAGLSTQLEGLFDEMKFSDVIFKVRGHEFPAHISILAARSEVFAAMFTHSTKENLTQGIEIDDIEPEVFRELLRFIYTGRLQSTSMETMAAGILIEADKYLLMELKVECENYLLCQMSPRNCVELIFHGDLLNPAEHLKKVLKEAAKCFRKLPSEVMTTAKWERVEKENPHLLLKIQKILLSGKV
jgi:speckle-type POZ protein